MGKWKEESGYLTIEMTIIFPAIFFSLILILFIGIVLYQEVKLQSLAVRASERGSMIYSARVEDMTKAEKTLADFKVRDPYRNVPFMDGGNKRAYVGIINQYVAKEVGDGNLLLGNHQYSTEVEDYLIAKRVRVNIQGGYTLPLDSIGEMFGHKGPFQVNTTAVSAVTDTPDFIRNVDLVTDIAKQTELFDTVSKGYEGIRNALQKVMNLLQ